MRACLKIKKFKNEEEGWSCTVVEHLKRMPKALVSTPDGVLKGHSRARLKKKKKLKITRE